MASVADINRFRARVTYGDGCWTWNGGLRSRRYGTISVQGRSVQAHRFAWEQANGPIPQGMCVCHKCDNPACVRPSHLFLGTQADNLRDMHTKGRHVPRYGVDTGMAKLTPEKVSEMRLAWSRGKGMRALGREYGVSHTSAYDAIKGRTWKHVP